MMFGSSIGYITAVVPKCFQFLRFYVYAPLDDQCAKRGGKIGEIIHHLTFCCNSCFYV